MLTGIMAIFEMGLALKGQSIIPSSMDAYLENPKFKSTDQKLLRLLSDSDQVNPGLEGSILCKAVIDAYQSTFPLDGISLVEDTRPSLNSNWLSACFMSDKTHRILISPGISSSSMPYQFYSCILDATEDKCSFEKGS